MCKLIFTRAAKGYVISNFILRLLLLEVDLVDVLSWCTLLETVNDSTGAIEVPSLGSHIVKPLLLFVKINKPVYCYLACFHIPYFLMFNLPFSTSSSSR